MSRLHHTYRKIFIAANGDGPWPCYGCKAVVLFEDLFVHHKDNDFENNDPSNMVPMHQGCHNTLHHLGRKNTPETRKKMSESAKRRYEDPEQRRLASEIQQKRNEDPSFRETMSRATKKRYEDPAEREKTSKALQGAFSQEERDRRSDRARQMHAEGKLGRKKKV